MFAALARAFAAADQLGLGVLDAKSFPPACPQAVPNMRALYLTVLTMT